MSAFVVPEVEEDGTLVLYDVDPKLAALKHAWMLVNVQGRSYMMHVEAGSYTVKSPGLADMKFSPR